MQYCKICVIGNKGNFGFFLENILLPKLNFRNVFGYDLGTKEKKIEEIIRKSTDIVLCVPLFIYTAETKKIIKRLEKIKNKKTLWLIASVQEEISREVGKIYKKTSMKNLSTVLIHPMYGPNSLKGRKPNILSEIFNSNDTKLKIKKLEKLMRKRFEIDTKTNFSPSEHDFITAKSQGLVYVFSKIAINDEKLSKELKIKHPEFFNIIMDDYKLLTSYLEINQYCYDIEKYFNEKWNETSVKSIESLIQCFKKIDFFFCEKGDTIPIDQYIYLKNT